MRTVVVRINVTTAQHAVMCGARLLLCPSFNGDATLESNESSCDASCDVAEDWWRNVDDGM